MPFTIERNDLTTMVVDAVVVPSDSSLAPTGGVAAAVAKAAGPQLLRILEKQAPCPTGGAVVTPAFDHPARILVHAVGPVWDEPSLASSREGLLSRAYESALQQALRHGAHSIALPLISAGSFGCPIAVSFAAAMRAVREFLLQNEVQVTLVVFDRQAVATANSLYGDIAEYIDDAHVEQAQECLGVSRSIRGGASNPFLRRPGAAMAAPRSRKAEPSALASVQVAGVPATCGDEAGLEQWLSTLDEPFTTTLLRLIDASGLTDAQVYKRANMSRQLFSRIRSDASYHPAKRTVLALAIALELDLQQTRDLLSRAGYALSKSSKSDLIVEFFLARKTYDIFAVNEALYAFDQPLL